MTTAAIRPATTERILPVAQQLRIALVSSWAGRWWFSPTDPGELTIVPQDLRTADPTLADDLFSGHFAFAGKVADCSQRSPFEIAPPSPEWEAVLHSFSWLRHIRAGDTNLRPLARLLVADWIRHHGQWHPTGWQAAIMSRRLRAWLCQSPLILEGADDDFYHSFLRQMVRQTRTLQALLPSMPTALDRLQGLITITMVGLCIEKQDKLAEWGIKHLGIELERQILSDGGHISRMPGALVELLIALLPLRQLFPSRDKVIPRPILTTIDRMFPALRFFRGGDGSLACFNGMGPSEVDLIATILRYDDTRGTIPASLPHSGYQRMAAGDTILLMDCGPPPPPEFSREAHAGALSFELWSANEALIVNCGLPNTNVAAWRPSARATAAHSTLTLADTSSAKTAGQGIDLRGGAPFVTGPRQVVVNRSDDAGHVLLGASHDGYRTEFGLIHERTLRLATNGLQLDGRDVLSGDGAKAPFALRFHLHPDTKTTPTQDHRTIILTLGDGQRWSFASDHPCAIEESIYLATPDRPRRSLQIVIAVEGNGARAVLWSLSRRDARPASPSPDGSEPELPL